MPGIIFQTNAVKVVNKGGGYPTKTFKEEISLGPLDPKKVIHRHMISTKKEKGTEYVVFHCPAPDCHKRNRRSVYEAKAQTQDGRLSFKCNKCYREIEVQRPMSQIEKPVPVPIPDARGFRPGTLLGPNGRPIGV